MPRHAIMDTVALASHKVDATACTFECCSIQRSTDWLFACFNLNFAKLPFNIGIFFKMIPLGKVSYKGLVSVKNMKPTSLNQNLDNFK